MQGEDRMNCSYCGKMHVDYRKQGYCPERAKAWQKGLGERPFKVDLSSISEFFDWLRRGGRLRDADDQGQQGHVREPALVPGHGPGRDAETGRGEPDSTI